MKKLILTITLSIIGFISITPQNIHQAAKNGEIETIRNFLKQDRSLINSRSVERNYSVLHNAFLSENVDLIKFLVNEGADVNAKDSENYSVLNRACAYGMKEIVKLLIDKGADVKNDFNAYGTHPIHFAANGGHIEIVKLILENGVDVNLTNRWGITSLHFAAYRNNTEMIQFLIDSGANLNKKDLLNGYTPLHNAVSLSQLENVKLLITNGADTGIRDNNGKTVLWMPIEKGDVESLKYLLSLCKNVNEKEKYLEYTPLHRASINGYEQIVELLLTNGADINIIDKLGNKPINYAVQYSHPSVIDMLVKAGSKMVTQSNARPQNKKLNFGEASIVYLGRSGWCVETQNNLLIFDYYREAPPPANPSLLNGHITASELKNKNVYVFISHVHRDHYDKVIHEWEKEVDNIHFIFGWKAHDNPDYIYMGPRQSTLLDGIEITSINSPELGDLLGNFLIKVDGVTLFHSGDPVDNETYRRDLEYLAESAGQVDLMFFTADNPNAFEFPLFAMEKVQPKYFFPMHVERGNENIFHKFKKTAASSRRKTNILIPHNRGDRFYYLQKPSR